MHTPRVLVVEDEPLICALTEEALADHGVIAACASNAADALEQLDRFADSLEVLITDINLGAGMDGYDLAIQARERRPDLFVLYVTGQAEGEMAARGVPGGMLLPKPYLPTLLAARVAAVLDARNDLRHRSHDH